jgi:hypothetical protein
MQQEIIFIPMLLLVLLKLQVWCYMYYTRISFLITNKIPVQSIANSRESQKILKDVSGPADNLINLFEMPVLFYVGVITTYVTGLADTSFLVLASSYVFLRYVHSFIHATYNQVHQRFIIYIVSTLVLWVYWIMLASKLIQKLN